MYKQKVKLLDRYYLRIQQIHVLRLKLAKTTMELKRLKQNLLSREKIMFPNLEEDQKQALVRKSTRGLKWSTIRKGLILKMKCETKGYSDLIERTHLFPSVRVLQERVQHLKFDNGILMEVFDILSTEVKKMNYKERQCSLMMDEMAITPDERFDTTSYKWVGQATLSTHSDISTKALVIMLAGSSTRWKQTVAWFLTRSMSDKVKNTNRIQNLTGKELRKILEDIIKKAEEIGLFVNCIITDMAIKPCDNQASDNQAM